MDFILFIKVLAWIGLIVSGALAGISAWSWYYHECTDAGRFEQQLMALKGQRIVGYYFMSRVVIFIICLAAIISFN